MTSRVTEFVEVREDGTLKPENMSLDAFVAQGWAPKIVNEARWLFDGRDVVIRNRFGLHAQVLPLRDGVVMIYDHNNSPPTCELRVINGDGSLRRVISNRQQINGLDCTGTFSWFSPRRMAVPSVFGVMFRTDGGSMWHLDIDANDGQVLAVHASN